MDLKERQEHLDKLLSYQVKFNKITEAKDLIDLGANVDAKDDEGVPVLAVAAEKGMLQMAEMLVKEGANLLETDLNGQTVFDRVMQKTAKSFVSPNRGDALLYATAIYLKNIFEGQNRYNGKREQTGQASFVMSIIKNRKNVFNCLRVGDREHG